MDMAIRQKMCYTGENQLPQERNATMKTQRDYPKYTVTPKAEATILRGHPWVYDAEILQTEGGTENGGLVDVVSKKGRYLLWFTAANVLFLVILLLLYGLLF